jgi:hypothetical protein
MTWNGFRCRVFSPHFNLMFHVSPIYMLDTERMYSSLHIYLQDMNNARFELIIHFDLYFVVVAALISLCMLVFFRCQKL